MNEPLLRIQEALTFGSYQGTSFSRAEKACRIPALAAVPLCCYGQTCSKLRPARHDCRARTFFATSKTFQGKCLLQSQRSAELLIDVFRSYTLAGKLKVREFVVMPDHFHVLVSLDGDTSIERAMQLIKGNYSFRRKKEFGFNGEVWQRGFSEVRITDQENYLARNILKTIRSGQVWPTRLRTIPTVRRIYGRRKKPAAKADLLLQFSARLKLVP